MLTRGKSNTVHSCGARFDMFHSDAEEKRRVRSADDHDIAHHMFALSVDGPPP